MTKTMGGLNSMKASFALTGGPFFFGQSLRSIAPSLTGPAAFMPDIDKKCMFWRQCRAILNYVLATRVTEQKTYFYYHAFFIIFDDQVKY